MKLSAFLFDELWREGVRQIFGIPGDFVLNLYEALEDDGRFRLIRLSHEPAVGFAADGAARITSGLGVCCITYGAGGLNMINPVACAYAEESPLVVLTGGPGQAEKDAAIHVHHEVKTFESQLKVYREVTEYAAILDDPRTAASHIRRAIEVALKMKRPVYLEIPRDMVGADIDVPGDMDHVALPVDEEAVDEAAQEILARLTRAEHAGDHRRRRGPPLPPARSGDRARRTAERSGRVVAARPRRVSDHHPNFIGTYLGVVSPPHAARDGRRLGLRAAAWRARERHRPRRVGGPPERYEPADCRRPRRLRRPSPLSTHAARPRRRGAPVVDRRCRGRRCPHTFRAISCRRKCSSPCATASRSESVTSCPSSTISLRPGPRHRLSSTLATALFAAVDIRANEIVGPGYYATMGFAVPAALGVEIASGRRPLVLVGDGAFQMTGAEISQAPAYGCRPIVVVFNNARWEMLQAFFPDAGYNATVPGRLQAGGAVGRTRVQRAHAR